MKSYTIMSELFDLPVMDALIHFAKYGDINEKIFIGIKTLLITCKSLVRYLPIERTFIHTCWWCESLNTVCDLVEWWTARCTFPLIEMRYVPPDDAPEGEKVGIVKSLLIARDNNNHELCQLLEVLPNKITSNYVKEKYHRKHITFPKKYNDGRKNNKRMNHPIKQPKSRCYKK